MKKFGEWALVTGSTDGIGKAFAFELAKRGNELRWEVFNPGDFLGLNVVLISRTKEKLEQIEKEIQSKYATTQVKTIPIDFTSKIYIFNYWIFKKLIFVEDNSIYSTIRQEIRGLDIGVVVNNVGMSYEYPETFDKVEDNEKFLNNMIRCNVDSVANITQMVLPGIFLVHSSNHHFQI